jgi:1-phosphatidylinositol-4-phosphate 5-kinase
MEVDGVQLIDDIFVTEFAPNVFAFLRLLDGYDQKDLAQSLDINANTENIKKAGEGEGKSGAFFFKTADEKFLIKTMSEHDFVGFMRIFRDYFRHMCKNELSLLARYYGIYAVEIQNFEKVYMLIMGNGIQYDKRQEQMQVVYDLKGSLDSGRTEKDPSKIQKDLNIKGDVNKREW